MYAIRSYYALANLLPRFYAPDAGRILLDGHDLQSLTLESLRANIALVSQDVVLFNDTIHANIAYGRQDGAVITSYSIHYTKLYDMVKEL